MPCHVRLFLCLGFSPGACSFSIVEYGIVFVVLVKSWPFMHINIGRLCSCLPLNILDAAGLTGSSYVQLTPSPAAAAGLISNMNFEVILVFDDCLPSLPTAAH
jgi:hypothetical protein